MSGGNGILVRISQIRVLPDLIKHFVSVSCDSASIIVVQLSSVNRTFLEWICALISTVHRDIKASFAAQAFLDQYNAV
jgi:hypothetical protein